MGAAADAYYEGVCPKEGERKQTRTLNPSGEPRCLDCGADLVEHTFVPEGGGKGKPSEADVAAATPVVSPEPAPEPQDRPEDHAAPKGSKK